LPINFSWVFQVTPTLSSSTSGFSAVPPVAAVPPPGIAIPGVGILPATLAPSVASAYVTPVTQSGLGPAVPGIPPPSIAIPTAIGGMTVPSGVPAPGLGLAASAANVAVSFQLHDYLSKS